MKPHTPETLPLKNLNYELLFPYLGEASSELARYDGLLQGIPNPTILLSPLTTKEAVLSSKIEGTQATVDEVLEQEAGMLKDAVKLLDTIFSRPIFETASLVNRSGINKKTAMSLIKTIRTHNILTILREPSGRKPAVYCFAELLKITEGTSR